MSVNQIIAVCFQQYCNPVYFSIVFFGTLIGKCISDPIFEQHFKFYDHENKKDLLRKEKLNKSIN